MKSPQGNTGTVFCDTSFLIRLANPREALHASAKAYFAFCLNHHMPLVVSTIALAEYEVRDRMEHPPLRNLRILPFNVEHAREAGEIARALFEWKNAGILEFPQRAVIPNDAKLFAQAEVESAVEWMLTADESSHPIHRQLAEGKLVSFRLMPLQIPVNQFFGELDFGESGNAANQTDT